MTPDTEGKSLVELLDLLKPAPEPAAISMMPQTWGWTVLGLLVLAAIATTGILFWRHHKLNAYRRAACSELDKIENDTAKVSQVLRRTALAVYPRSEVAGLYGEDWLSFLRQTADINKFSDKAAHDLISAPYQKSVTNTEAVDLARHWIKFHKIERVQ